MLAHTEHALGHLAAARRHLQEAVARWESAGIAMSSAYRTAAYGQLALWEDDPAIAAAFYEESVRLVADTDELALWIKALIGASEAHLATGHDAAALAASERAATDPSRARSRRIQGISVTDLWWQHRQALRANGKAAAARRALATAYRFVVERVSKLTDEGLRRNFLNKIPRSIARSSRRRSRSASAPTSAVPRTSRASRRCSEPFERLVDTGLRMNELRSPRRVAGLPDRRGDRALGRRARAAGARIGRWTAARGLAAARRARMRSRLLQRHRALRSNDAGADAHPRALRTSPPARRNSRSARASSRRSSSQRGRRLPVRRHRRRVRPLPRRRPRPARRCSRARPRSRSTMRSGRRGSSRRSRSARKSCNVECADRAARERARDHQQHPAGHRRRASTSRRSSTSSATSCARCSKTDDIGIRWYDDETPDVIHYLYEYEHGERLSMPSADADRSDSLVIQAMSRRARRSSSIRARRQRRSASACFPGTDASAIDACRAHRRQRPRAGHASCSRTTSASTLSARPKSACCSTVAASMGVALENARLFDETQRLLKETEQRNAELAVINSIQQGIAGSSSISRPSSTWSATSCARCCASTDHRHPLVRPRHAQPRSLPVRDRARHARRRCRP